MTPDPWCTVVEHGGTSRCYSNGCRCTPARRAVAARNAIAVRRRAIRGPARVDCIGTQRRIRALVAVGWHYKALAAELFWPVSFLCTLATNPRPVSTHTAERISEAYDRLRYQRGPSPLAARRALNKGWAQPWAWHDDLIDDPHTQPGDRPTVAPTLPDRLAPFADGYTDRDVLDDQADRAFELALDAIEADDEAWFAARRAPAELRAVA